MIATIAVITGKKKLSYPNNHPPFLLNCYLFVGFKIFTHKLRNLSDPGRRQTRKFGFKFGKLSCCFTS